MKETKVYTVHEITDLLGITRKTLFYYDRKDLLKPAFRSGPQMHKIYDEEGLAQLKSILQYRSAGLSIGEIKALLNKEEEKSVIFQKAMKRLEKDKAEKETEIRNLKALIAGSVDSSGGNECIVKTKEGL